VAHTPSKNKRMRIKVLGPEVPRLDWRQERGLGNFKRCHRSLNRPAASAYKLRRRGLSGYGLKVTSVRHLGAIHSGRQRRYSVVEQHLGEGWSTYAPDSNESGAFCFVPTWFAMCAILNSLIVCLWCIVRLKRSSANTKSGSSLVGGHGLTATFDPYVRPHHSIGRTLT
jgi:hypothetical protein